jgi:hypothetical protein
VGKVRGLGRASAAWRAAGGRRGEQVGQIPGVVLSPGYHINQTMKIQLILHGLPERLPLLSEWRVPNEWKVYATDMPYA